MPPCGRNTRNPPGTYPKNFGRPESINVPSGARSAIVFQSLIHAVSVRPERLQRAQGKQIARQRHDEVVAIEQKHSIQGADIWPRIEKHVVDLELFDDVAHQFTNRCRSPKALGLPLKALGPEFGKIVSNSESRMSPGRRKRLLMLVSKGWRSLTPPSASETGCTPDQMVLPEAESACSHSIRFDNFFLDQ